MTCIETAPARKHSFDERFLGPVLMLALQCELSRLCGSSYWPLVFEDQPLANLVASLFLQYYHRRHQAHGAKFCRSSRTESFQCPKKAVFEGRN